jgi:hypothetical protein
MPPALFALGEFLDRVLGIFAWAAWTLILHDFQCRLSHLAWPFFLFLSFFFFFFEAGFQYLSS